MSIKTKSNVTYLGLSRSINRKYSQHALKRSQQRGVSKNAINYILDYGNIKHDKHGGVVHYLSSKDKRFINKSDNNLFKDLEKRKNIFVVTSATSGEVITVGHRYRRVFN